jgi:hypothetical protein
VATWTKDEEEGLGCGQVLNPDMALALIKCVQQGGPPSVPFGAEKLASFSGVTITALCSKRTKTMLDVIA